MFMKYNLPVEVQAELNNVTQTPQPIKISKGTIELYQYFQDMGIEVLTYIDFCKILGL